MVVGELDLRFFAVEEERMEEGREAGGPCGVV